jgi:ribosome-associated protein
MTPTAAESTVHTAVRAALDKRAERVVVLDLQGLSAVADYFVLASGRVPTHLETIAEAVQAALRSAGIRLRHREGTAASGWLLLDAGDVVVHLFLPETRDFYALERLWGDAPARSVEASPERDTGPTRGSGIDLSGGA